MNRPETIEETAALVDEAGGRGIAVRVDHLDIWGATTMEWNKSVWESSLDIGLRPFRLAVELA